MNSAPLSLTRETLTGVSRDAFRRRNALTGLLTGLLVVAVGATVSAGWFFDSAALRNLLAGQTPMKPNTALCFILSGAALIVNSLPPAPARIHAARFCNLLSGLIGLLTLGEYVSGWDFGIDQLLFRESSDTPATLHPSRMAPDTALCFVLLAAGLELTFRTRKTMAFFLSAMTLVSLVTAVSLTAAVSHLMELIGAFGLWGITPMALPTALLFIFMGMACVLTSWPPDISIWSFHGRSAAACAVWTFLLAGSLVWSLHREERYALQTAAAFARANINKDISFRQWATSHGGVYVRSDNETPPNPYLQHPARDVQTTTGVKLTLMNPAYIMRELQHNFGDEYGTRSRITSLTPLNPINSADAWQAKALKNFVQGAKELQEVQNLNGVLYLRIMQPFIVESGCMTCHAGQGYQLGDVRGGIDSSVPLETYLAPARERGSLLALSHGGIWVIGLLGLGFSYRRESLLNTETEQATAALKSSEERFRIAAESANDLVYEWDMKQKLQWFGTIDEMLGYAPGEFPRTLDGWREALHPEDLETVMTAVRDHLDLLVPYSIEYRIRRKDGEYCWWSARGTVTRDSEGQPLRWVGTVTDITERKNAEKVLKDYNAELERFNYTLSHELRSPLVTVKSFLEFLTHDLAAGDGERIAKDIGYMHTATDKMTQLLDQLVMISRIGRVVNPPVAVTFSELVGDVLDRLAERIAEQGAEIDVDQCAIEFFGDRPRLTEIWHHLLDNALTFRDERPLRIRIGVALENSIPRFYVSDNGCGIDPRYHEKIFGLFDKLDAKNKGTGLGLALVKRIVEMYNGAITVESEGLGHGSCFRFTLPGALKGNETSTQKETM